MNPIELGKFIANLRNEKKLTQEELADKLYIDKRKISRWECGTSIPDFETLIKLTEILDVTLYELSICQRIKDESITSKTINKFKSLKDLKKLKFKKILCIIIAILLGIFFGITTIYTIDNYETVEIYKFETMDEDFTIEGNYIKARNKNIVNIFKIGSKFSTLIDDYTHVKYELFKGRDRIFNIQNTDNYENDLNKHYYISTNNNEIKCQLNENDILSFRVQFLDDESQTKYESYNFKLVKVFKNTLF